MRQCTRFPGSFFQNFTNSGQMSHCTYIPTSAQNAWISGMIALEIKNNNKQGFQGKRLGLLTKKNVGFVVDKLERSALALHSQEWVTNHRHPYPWIGEGTTEHVHERAQFTVVSHLNVSPPHPILSGSPWFPT